MEAHDDPAFRAEQDQYLAGLKDTARTAKAFHEMLTAEGLTGHEAALITGSWLAASVGAQVSKNALEEIFKPDHDEDE